MTPDDLKLVERLRQQRQHDPWSIPILPPTEIVRPRLWVYVVAVLALVAILVRW